MAGSKTGPSRPEVPATIRPPIQWLTRSVRGAGRATPGSATCVIGDDLFVGAAAAQAARVSTCRSRNDTLRRPGQPRPRGRVRAWSGHGLTTDWLSEPRRAVQNRGRASGSAQSTSLRMAAGASEAERDPRRATTTHANPAPMAITTAIAVAARTRRPPRIAPGSRDEGAEGRPSGSPARNSRPSRAANRAGGHGQRRGQGASQRDDAFIGLCGMGWHVGGERPPGSRARVRGRPGQIRWLPLARPAKHHG